MNLKHDFPIFMASTSSSNPLAYLDSAATSQKPKVVIDSISEYYQKFNANVHRGIYNLSEVSSNIYEQARSKVANFINADVSECFFVKNATEGLNAVAKGIMHLINEDDEIIVSALEHHANLIPWQEVAKTRKAKIIIAPLDKDNCLDYAQLQKLTSSKTKVIACTHMSNVTGTTVDLKKISAIAKKYNSLTVIDGTQGIVHLDVDIKKFDIDFYVFTGHKLYAPMGAAVVFGKKTKLESLQPFLYGGNMLIDASYFAFTEADIPQRFEAGTPDVAAVFGLMRAIDYLQDLGLEKIRTYEAKLSEYMYEQLESAGVNLIKSKASSAIASFYFDKVHAHDIATIIDAQNVAVRAGQHCAIPLIKYLGAPSLVRCSIGIYNDEQDIQQLLTALNTVKKLFKVS